MIELTFEESRVLGVLVEKERTTPDYYPLTLNSLTTACNQKSNRDPVVDFSETDVINAIDSLMKKRLIGRVSGSGSRAVKYRHALVEALEFQDDELAALAVLMLRGPQTPGEIRTRTSRLHAFADLDAVQDTLDRLGDGEDPYVIQLPRQSGQKEARYGHMLCGEPELPPEEEVAPVRGSASVALEQEVLALREELDALREEFDRFRGQFT